MDTQEFIDKMVNIEYVESSKCYGHYPFSMRVEKPDEQIELCALSLGGNVLECWLIIKKKIQEGAVKILVALDYPAAGDIKNDFVGVFTIANNKVEILAIPYDNKTGKAYPVIRQSEILDMIHAQITEFIKL